MMTCTIDEAVRRLIAVGGRLSHMGGVDNFCWPDIQFHPEKNPDGRFKAAQLVRACRALKDACLAYGVPLLSGKDSMYVDGYLTGAFGQSVKVSALETVQFSATCVVEDVTCCRTLAPVADGDGVYVLGATADELGASEYYELLGHTGAQVPEVHFDRFKVIYRALEAAMSRGLIASAHAVARGGLGVHLALTALAGNLGMEVDLSRIPRDETRGGVGDIEALCAESAGRFIVTVAPEHGPTFEKMFRGTACGRVGRVTGSHARLKIDGVTGKTLCDLSLSTLETAWTAPLGGMI